MARLGGPCWPPPFHQVSGDRGAHDGYCQRHADPPRQTARGIAASTRRLGGVGCALPTFVAASRPTHILRTVFSLLLAWLGRMYRVFCRVRRTAWVGSVGRYLRPGCDGLACDLDPRQGSHWFLTFVVHGYDAWTGMWTRGGLVVALCLLSQTRHAWRSAGQESTAFAQGRKRPRKGPLNTFFPGGFSKEHTCWKSLHQNQDTGRDA